MLPNTQAHPLGNLDLINDASRTPRAFLRPRARGAENRPDEGHARGRTRQFDRVLAPRYPSV